MVQKPQSPGHTDAPQPLHKVLYSSTWSCCCSASFTEVDGTAQTAHSQTNSESNSPGALLCQGLQLLNCPVRTNTPSSVISTTKSPFINRNKHQWICHFLPHKGFFSLFPESSHQELFCFCGMHFHQGGGSQAFGAPGISTSVLDRS